MTEQPKKGRTFTFVNVTDPYQAEQAGIRKRVRSAAASDGWAVSKEPSLRSSSARKPERNLLPTPLSEWCSDAVNSQQVDNPRKDSSSSLSSSCTSSTSSGLSVDNIRSTSTPENGGGLKRKAESWRSSRQHPPSLTSSSPRANVLDPFSAYPIKMNTCFKRLFKHFYEHMAPGLSMIVNCTPEQSDSYAQHTHRLMMHEPALFYMRLFASAAQLVTEGRLKREIALWLRGQTIRAIQEALNDPDRLHGKGLIVTIRLIAIHECVFGDKNISIKVHRPALTRLIEMAGGLQSWDSLPIEKDLTIWYDSFISRMTGTPRVWGEMCSRPVLDIHIQMACDIRRKGEKGGI